MFLHIRFLVETFATELTWKWSKMNFNFPFEELEYLEIAQIRKNTNLVSVWISKCVESVELLLNCLLQM